MELGRLWTLRRKMGLLRYLKAQQSFCLDDSRRMGSMAPAEGLLSSRRETELSSKEEWGQAIARAQCEEVGGEEAKEEREMAIAGDLKVSAALGSYRIHPLRSSPPLSSKVRVNIDICDPFHSYAIIVLCWFFWWKFLFCDLGLLDSYIRQCVLRSACEMMLWRKWVTG